MSINEVYETVHKACVFPKAPRPGEMPPGDGWVWHTREHFDGVGNPCTSGEWRREIKAGLTDVIEIR